MIALYKSSTTISWCSQIFSETSHSNLLSYRHFGKYMSRILKPGNIATMKMVLLSLLSSSACSSHRELLPMMNLLVKLQSLLSWYRNYCYYQYMIYRKRRFSKCSHSSVLRNNHATPHHILPPPAQNLLHEAEDPEYFWGKCCISHAPHPRETSSTYPRDRYCEWILYALLCEYSHRTWELENLSTWALHYHHDRVCRERSSGSYRALLEL